jgi:uncharacterized membrane protein
MTWCVAFLIGRTAAVQCGGDAPHPTAAPALPVASGTVAAIIGAGRQQELAGAGDVLEEALKALVFFHLVLYFTNRTFTWKSAASP